MPDRSSLSSQPDPECKSVLVTGGRVPSSVGLVHALERSGARVDAADGYRYAVGPNSSSVTKAHIVPAPATKTLAFIDAVAGIVRERAIDLVVPSFEESYYLARYRHRIPALVFAPNFEAICKLHSKAAFVNLCAQLGLPTPKTAIATSQTELAEVIGRFDRFYAKPAFSRGGAYCLTNCGQRADETQIGDCTPTEDNPWVVQSFIEGKDASTFSIVRDGKVLVHGVYEPVLAATGGFCVSFTSIDDFGTLPIAQTVAQHFDYTGFLCFDCRRTDDEFVLLECNPRLDAGVFLAPPEWVGEALLADVHPDTTRLVEAGTTRQYDAILSSKGQMEGSLRDRVRLLLTQPDALADGHDLLPAILFYTGRRHWRAVAERDQIDYVTAFVGDVSWDGSQMPNEQD